MSKQLDIIRDSNVSTSKNGRGKHHTSDNSSGIALKRRIHARVATQAKTQTLFGEHSKGTDKRPNNGSQSTYLYFKSIFPSMSINSVTKQ